MSAASSPPSLIVPDVALINRRHALGLLAAASILPSRGFANVAPQRSEIREDLARHFTDEGTVGTFVGYKTDDYLVIASDNDHAGMMAAKKAANAFLGRGLAVRLLRPFDGFKDFNDELRGIKS